MSVDVELEDYALRFGKIRHKKYELFVVSRIVHLLNDREIEFTTQQLVRTNTGRFLLDLYFPQFKYAIEVDEVFHSKEENILLDKTREKAIVEVSDVEFDRVEIENKSFSDVNQKIDYIVQKIRNFKKESENQKNFRPYVIGQNYDVEHWLSLRNLSSDSPAMFRRHVDVARIFGRNLRGHQRAVLNLGDGASVWFPKLYKNGDWNNDISPDGNTITMIKEAEGKFEAKSDLSGDIFVFAHYTDEFGKVFYSFKGVYRLDKVTDKGQVFTKYFDSFSFDGLGGFSPFKS